jgi:hypothetical protein
MLGAWRPSLPQHAAGVGAVLRIGERRLRAKGDVRQTDLVLWKGMGETWFYAAAVGNGRIGDLHVAAGAGGDMEGRRRVIADELSLSGRAGSKKCGAQSGCRDVPSLAVTRPMLALQPADKELVNCPNQQQHEHDRRCPRSRIELTRHSRPDVYGDVDRKPDNAGN